MERSRPRNTAYADAPTPVPLRMSSADGTAKTAQRSTRGQKVIVIGLPGAAEEMATGRVAHALFCRHVRIDGVALRSRA